MCPKRGANRVRDRSEIFYLPAAQRKEIKIGAESPTAAQCNAAGARHPQDHTGKLRQKKSFNLNEAKDLLI